MSVKRKGRMPEVGKVFVGIAMVAPLAFLMGTPFPWGLSVLHEKAATAVPLAWAVNGFASVVSACGAVLLAMTFGFKSLLSLAAGLYAVAGLLSLLTARWNAPPPVKIHSDPIVGHDPAAQTLNADSFSCR